jgi:hypothetical protein
VASLAQQQRALVEQHRQAQVANRAGFLAQFLAAWGLLDIADLDRSTPNWLRIVLRLIAAFRQDSASLSLRHYRDLRRLGLPNVELEMPDVDFRRSDLDALVRDTRYQLRHYADHGPSNPVRLTREPLRREGRQRGLIINWDRADRAAETALRVTGPINIKHRISRGEDPEKAMRNAFVDASGSASRQVMNGGRGTMLTLVQNDQVAIGWVRITDSNPCAFCAMLASRGVTWGPYAPDSFKKSNEGRKGRTFDAEYDKDPRIIKRGEVKVHDHCACAIAPVFSREDSILDQGKQYRELWDRYIKDKYGGKDAILAWRRLHERPEVFKRKLQENSLRRAA